MEQTLFELRLQAKQAQRIPMRAFEGALADLGVILHEVEAEMATGREGVTWEIADLGMGSVMVAVMPATASQEELARQVGHAVAEGLKSLGRDQVRPPHFSDKALESAARLARLLSEELTAMRLSFANQVVELNQVVAAHVRGILEYVQSVGSVQGTLEVLAGPIGRDPYFRVRDAVTDFSVTCTMPEDLIPVALAAFRKRVLASGTVHYESGGRARAIAVNSIEILPPDEDLPRFEDVRGIYGELGGLVPEEYLEQHFYGD